MTGKEKLYFLLNRIDDARVITPAGQPLLIHPANNLNNNISAIELHQLFTKLEKDEKILIILQIPNRVRNAILEEYQQYQSMDDGCYHIKLLPAFDNYFLSIQNELEYQEFSGRRPVIPVKLKSQSENLSAERKPMPLSADIVSYDLQAQYAEIQSEKNDTIFFLKVAAYGKYLNTCEISHPLLNQLHEEKQNQISALKYSWKSFYENWKKYAKDIIETADAAGIKDVGPLQNEIEKVRSYLNQPEPSFSDANIPDYYHSYREIILRFDKLGKKDLIAEKHLDKDNNLRIFPEYNNTQTEWDKYTRIREISTWWSHYQISRLAYGVIGNHEEKMLYFQDDNEIDKLYKFEYEELGRNPGYTPIFLRRKKFEEWVTKLHNYIIPRLRGAVIENKTSNSPITTAKTATYSSKFDDKEPAIFINNIKISLPPFKNEHYFCRALFKKKVGHSTDWSIIYEKMQGDYHSTYNKPLKIRDNWRPIYDTMNRVNSRIKSQIDTVGDLFSWNDLTIKRNF